MAILNITLGTTGLVGVEPRVIYINTNDTLATVTAAGYLNHARQQGFAFQESDMACVTTKPAPNSPVTEVAWLEVSLAGGNASLVPTGAPGQVVLPTIANAIVHATNVTGTLSTAAAAIFNLGNISAGQSGTAGSLFSFPAAAGNGFLQITAVANGAARNTIITNAALGQTTTFTIPDPGVAATNFLLTNGVLQTIATGALAITSGLLAVGSVGNPGTIGLIPTTALNGQFILLATNAGANFTTTLTNGVMGQSTVFTIPDPGVAATNFLLTNGVLQTIATGALAITSGLLSMGSVGNPGTLTLVPTTAANGQFILLATNAGGAFNTTLTNGTMAQSTVFTIPDVTNAVGRVLAAATATPFTTNHLMVASGTGGAVVDAGYQMKTVAAAVVAGGAAAQVVVDAFVTAGSNIVASWNTQTNAASILTVTPGVGSFTVTSTADPGASTLNYIVTKV